MKVLQLCHKPPLPPLDGGSIAMNNITQGLLHEGHEVKVLTIYTLKHDLKWDAFSDEYKENTKIEGVFVDTSINLADAFSSLITRDSYNVSRFFSPDFDIKLTHVLKREKFDVIHLESLFMTPYIATCRRQSNAKIVLRSHNLEFIIWERMASGTRNRAKKAYLKYLSRKLRSYELAVIDQVDGIAAISKPDRQKYLDLGGKKPIVDIPFGIDVDRYQPKQGDLPELALFHLGSLDWSPNLEGVLWFLEDVWPKILYKFPKLKFYLAGRNIPADLADENYPQVEIVGEVENAHEFINSKAIMIVPLLSASGMRVKIIEGMALGKTIISTKIGAEGLDYTPGEELLIACSADEFVEAVDQLVSHPERIPEVGKRARSFVENKYNNRRIAKDLIHFYEALIAG